MQGLKHLDKVDYINTHGTSTPAGDITELKAIKEVLEPKFLLSHQQSHLLVILLEQLVHEVIYSLLMMKNNFLCGSHNIEEIDPEAKNFPILKENVDTKIN